MSDIRVVITAHPDDAEYGCGGSIAKWASGGAIIHIAVLTDGSKGSHDPTADAAALVAARLAEQRAGAKVLGARQVISFGFCDGELSRTDEAVSQVAALLRRIRPGVVVAHDPWQPYQLHPDHRAAGLIAVDAVYRAAEPRFARPVLDGLAFWKVQELWLFAAGDHNHVECLTEHCVELKAAALLEHRSQWRTSFGIDGSEGRTSEKFAATVIEAATTVGAIAGVGYGEGFRRIHL